MSKMFAVSLAIVSACSVSALRAQEIDKVLSRVNDNVVTASDVWRAKTLKLVPRQGAAVPPADAAVQRELENRLLMLAEVSRFSIAPPTADQLAARRTAWRARFAGADPGAVLTSTGTTPAAVDDWLRDDARIETYLDQQFTQPDATVRAAAVANWIDGLRRRAGLPR